MNLSGFSVVISWPRLTSTKMSNRKMFTVLCISLTVIPQKFSALLCLKVVHY